MPTPPECPASQLGPASQGWPGLAPHILASYHTVLSIVFATAVPSLLHPCARHSMLKVKAQIKENCPSAVSASTLNLRGGVGTLKTRFQEVYLSFAQGCRITNRSIIVS